MGQDQFSKDWATLEDGVRALLLAGKRSKDREFQVLFQIYGKQKVTEIAQKILADMRGFEHGSNT